MDGLEITEFLAGGWTGVLALARDDDGYGIPVSYEYDEADGDVFFRFGYGSESQKRTFVEASRRASFVVYEETEEGWKSVVARGPLERLTTDTADSTVVEAVRNLDIPYVTVHDHPEDQLDFEIVRLEVQEVDGVVEGR